MVDGDFSFSFSMGSGPGKRPEAAVRYIAVPFDAQPVGSEALIRPAGKAVAFRLPLFHAQLLGACDALTGLGDHQHRAMERFGLAPQQTGALQAALQDLVQRDLLQPEDRVFESLRVGAAEAFEPIEVLFIRTCDRADELERLMAELVAVAPEAELDRIVVLDDSRADDAVARNAGIVECARRQHDLPVTVIDRRRRTRIVDCVARAAGVDAASLNWTIEGDEDELPSYGAGLNLALLLGAGRRIALIDDDAGLAAYARETRQPSLSLQPNFEPETRLIDPGEADAESGPGDTAAFRRVEVNPLVAHAEILGCTTASLVERFGRQQGRLLERLTPGLLHDFGRAPRVRLTTNGTLGDSGAGGPAWIYAADAEILQACSRDPETYRRCVLGRRSARYSDRIEIAPGGGLMTTTLTGIDARELLLPTLARGRGEDLVFGALVDFLYPTSPGALLPFMLRHRQVAQSPWSSDELARGRGADRARWLVDRIDHVSATVPSRSAEHRALALGSWFDDLAACDSNDIIESLRSYLLDTRARHARGMMETRDALNPPEWIGKDFDALIAADLTFDETTWRGLAPMARSIGRFARGYGAALPAWCTAWRWCAGQDPESILERAG
jgi:hypothetical protein